jgi:hypothetical protein
LGGVGLLCEVVDMIIKKILCFLFGHKIPKTVDIYFPFYGCKIKAKWQCFCERCKVHLAEKTASKKEQADRFNCEPYIIDMPTEKIFPNLTAKNGSF